VRRSASVLLVSVLLTGCGVAVENTTPPPGARATPCGTFSIAVNAWVGYEANVAVVAYLAKNRLGCTVVEKDLTEEESWKALAAGDIDAILENWGHDEYKKDYIDRQKVIVEHGITGNKGIIGWYVPPWMAEEHPDIKDWKNLNKYADVMKSAQSGDKGQLLDGDPSYVTNDEALVANLGLNYKVVYAGTEDALIQAFKQAQANRKPMLGYFYEPQWLFSEIQLVNVALPAYKPGCDADPKTVKCGYQTYDLDKIASRKFAMSGSPAATLVKNFKWTNNDQNEVARAIAVGGKSRDEAAKAWLDAHPDIVKEWLAGT
jgi:glycine betaine/proline transport system substrate-binding protein